jgi:hypothetical protein
MAIQGDVSSLLQPQADGNPKTAPSKAGFKTEGQVAGAS